MDTSDRSADAGASREAVCACAFYGNHARGGWLREAHNLLLGWFEAIGHRPDRGGLSGPGYTARMTNFDAMERKLRRTSFGGLESFELEAMEPGWSDRTRYVASASASARDGCLHFAVDERVQTRDVLAQSRLVDDLLRSCSPAYAICYSRPRSLGPDWYAVGVLLGDRSGRTPIPDEEARRICRWGDMAMPAQVYQCGLLRDVYPVSFLNQAQLSSRVGSVSLEQWIRQDPARGSLAPAAAQLTRWDVPPENIARIFGPLWDAGVIFDWRRHGDVKYTDAEAT